MAEKHSISLDAASKALARARSRSMKGKHATLPLVRDPPLSLEELLSIPPDRFPNNAEFDSFGFPSLETKASAILIGRKFNFPPTVEVGCPKPGDRTCNWHPRKLFVYRDAIEAGFRLPLDEFVVRLLAEVGANPCQLSPNAWRYIYIFMLRCIELNIEYTTTLFRSIFLFKNSPEIRKGWLSIQHRPGVPHLFNHSSLRDKDHDWQRHFFVVRWKGGDWGKLFKPRFSHVKDTNDHIMYLSPEELRDRDKLIADDGQSHAKLILNECALVRAGLSIVSMEGNFCSFLCL